MSQMPDKIWLHKETKYSTADSVCGYQYKFLTEEEGIDKFVEYTRSDIFIKRADEFISAFFHPDDTDLIDAVLNRFHKHMELE